MVSLRAIANMFKWPDTDGNACQTLMWLLCVSRCSANGESRHPAHLQWKRWRSLDEDKSTSWYRGGQGAVWVTVFTAEIPKVLGLDKKDTGEQDAIILSIYVEAPPTTHTHFSTTNETSPTPPHLLPTSLWQRQQLSDISFHYCSTPCLYHRWALDEARSTVNCQAELIGTWGRRWEWLRNWNELEWKTRLWEWDDLDFPYVHLTHLRLVL